MAKADSDTTDSQPTESKKQSPVDLLTEIASQLKTLRGLVESEFENTFPLQNVKQKMQEAQTGIEQELRNIKIDAEMETKRLEEEARKAKLGAL